MSFWDHNGSVVRMFRWPGGQLMMAVDTPRADLKGVSPRGTVMVTGRIRGNSVKGRAGAFKKDCPAAEFAISGSFNGVQQETLVLRGAAPVRRGCRVIRHTTKGGATTLTFTRRQTPSGASVVAGVASPATTLAEPIANPAAGEVIARDLVTGVMFLLPREMKGRQTTTSYGLNWKSDDGRINIDTFAFPFPSAACGTSTRR